MTAIANGLLVFTGALALVLWISDVVGAFASRQITKSRRKQATRKELREFQVLTSKAHLHLTGTNPYDR